LSRAKFLKGRGMRTPTGTKQLLKRKDRRRFFQRG